MTSIAEPSHQVGVRRSGKTSFIVAAVATLAAVGLLSVFAPQADATTALPTAVSAHFDDAYAALEQGGIPSDRTPVPCSGICSELWASEHGPIPNQPTSDTLWRDFYALREETKLLPSPATMLGRVSLGVTAFTAGWVIGTTIRKVFITSDVPAQSNGVYGAVPVKAGDILPGAPTSALVAPSDGWLGLGICGSPGCFTQNSQYQGQCTRYGPLDAPPPGWSWVSAPNFFNFDCGTAILRSMPFRATALRVFAYTGQTASQGSVTWPYYADHGTNGEPVSTTSARARSELENHPERYPTLLPWLDAHLGGNSTDPTGQLIKMPACRGDSYPTCHTALQNAGFTGTITQQTLSSDDAVMQEPADQATATNPAVGTQTAYDADITVYVNPAAASMPVAVPQPQPDETLDEYTTRAQAVGLQVNAQPVIDDEDLVADAVTQVTPSDRVLPHAALDVAFNPETPATADNDEPDCRLSDPSGVDPLPSATNYFDVYQNTTFGRMLGSREIGFPGGTQTALLVGNVRAVAFNKGGFVGFGYRKIMAKHGWSQADKDATTAALQTEPEYRPLTGTPTRAIYTGAEYSGQNEALCARVVVVALTAQTLEPGPRQLITSYGRKIG